MLDVPAGIVPVAPVSPRDVTKLTDSDAFKVDGDQLLRWQRNAAKGSEGLPNAVQVVGLRNCEEKVLRVMKIIEDNNAKDVKRLKWKKGELPNNFGKLNGRQKSEALFDRVSPPVPNTPADNPIQPDDSAPGPSSGPVIPASNESEVAAGSDHSATDKTDNYDTPSTSNFIPNTHTSLPDHA